MANSAGRAILIIDEQQRRKSALSSRLRTQGFTIDLATGGFHAIHLAEKNTYNLVMMIDDMDDMPAPETLGLIRNIRDCKTLPVLVMRSDGNELDEEDQGGLRANQVNEILPWKDEFNNILRKIQTHLV